MFDRFDVDGDGFITVVEFDDMMETVFTQYVDNLDMESKLQRRFSLQGRIFNFNRIVGHSKYPETFPFGVVQLYHLSGGGGLPESENNVGERVGVSPNQNQRQLH